MASYQDEHITQSDPLAIARLLLSSGWATELGLAYETLFPRSKGADPAYVKTLTRIVPKDMPRQEDQCLICLDTWKDSKPHELVMKLPCNHFVHEKCVKVWFEKANSCPACRHELPSSDPDYEEFKRQQKRQKERQQDIDELHDSMFS